MTDYFIAYKPRTKLTVSFGCSCGTSISLQYEMDSKTDSLVQTIVTQSNDRLKPVMRFSCVLSKCFVCKQIAKDWPALQFKQGKLSYRQCSVWDAHMSSVFP